jgi:hypothetical protein
MLRKITANEGKTRMNANSLSICFAPCLLEDTSTYSENSRNKFKIYTAANYLCLDLVDSARRVPELIIYLMENAPDLLDGFSEDGPLLDSGSSCTTVSRPATDIDEDEQRGTLHLVESHSLYAD